MALKAGVTVNNGYFGKWVTNPNSKKKYFVEYGREVILKDILDNVETGEVSLLLSFSYFDEMRSVKIPNKEICDLTLLTKLNKQGANLAKMYFNELVELIRAQHDAKQINGYLPVKEYKNLGWVQLPIHDPVSGTITKTKLHYRAQNLIGELTGVYDGNYHIKPVGTFEAWKAMVENEVLGNAALEVVLLASLAAVVVGMIDITVNSGNPIIHLYGVSSSGKSTALHLAVSAFGQPFVGKKVVTDKCGNNKEITSLLRSWSATENALITSCAGNCGAVVVLDELGKYRGNSISRIIYALSDGDDKDRMTQDLEVVSSASYHTTFLSAGEFSMLDRCADRSAGLQNRVLELSTQFTNGAEHADRIKACCSKNCGWAAPMLAEYLINNGGKAMAIKAYNEAKTQLLACFPETPYIERYASKFGAYLLATARLAGSALGIQFSEDLIVEFLKEHEKNNGVKRNTALAAYEEIVEHFRIHIANFYTEDNRFPREVWGRMANANKVAKNSKVVSEQFLVMPSIVKQFLAEHGFPNYNTVIAAWKEASLLDYEEGKSTRKRKIAPTDTDPIPVYAFNIFADEEAESTTPPQKIVKIMPKRRIASKIKNLLADEDSNNAENTPVAEADIDIDKARERRRAWLLSDNDEDIEEITEVTASAEEIKEGNDVINA